MTKLSSMPSTVRSKALRPQRPQGGSSVSSSGGTGIPCRGDSTPMGARYARWVLRRRQLVIDAGIAAIVFAASLGLLAGGGAASTDEDFRSLDGLGVALAALASLPLVGRRHAPLATFAFTAAASAALNGLGYPPGPPLGPTVALYFLAVSPDDARARPRVIAATVATLFVVHVAAVSFADEGFPTVPLLFGALVWGGAWVVGDRVRQRRGRVAELEERARRAERDAERERRL